jgi:hypothetical protein
MDGKHSLERYFINNFHDGYNVDCMDLAQRKLIPSKNKMKIRPWLSGIKLSCIGLVGAVFLSQQMVC